MLHTLGHSHERRFKYIVSSRTALIWAWLLNDLQNIFFWRWKLHGPAWAASGWPFRTWGTEWRFSEFGPDRTIRVWQLKRSERHFQIGFLDFSGNVSSPKSTDTAKSTWTLDEERTTHERRNVFSRWSKQVRSVMSFKLVSNSFTLETRADQSLYIDWQTMGELFAIQIFTRW